MNTDTRDRKIKVKSPNGMRDRETITGESHVQQSRSEGGRRDTAGRTRHGLPDLRQRKKSLWFKVELDHK